MNLKASKSGLRRKNMNPNNYVHCWVTGCHGNAIGFNKKVSCEGLLAIATSISQCVCRVRQ